MKLFGTDGIRARAGEFPLNAAAIVAAGQALGERLRGPILVGQDTRISGPWIYKLLKEGLLRTEGVAVEDGGVLPTPAVALLTRTQPFSGGIMISASHNPFADNGIKVFSRNGTKLPDDDEAQIERRILELLPKGEESRRKDVIAGEKGCDRFTTWALRYEDLLIEHFRPGTWLKGLRIVVDCANGAMSAVAPQLLERLGAEVRTIHADPSGRNINENSGALHLESLASAMAEAPADIGVAFDGDGDRSLFVSSSGRRIDGDVVLLLIARKMKPSRVVGTLMTNYALERMFESEGVGLTRVGVGDRYVFEAMGGASDVVGGEPSGHIIFPDFGLSGDGLLTALKVAEVLVDSRKSLDELAVDWTPAPQMLKGVRVAQRIPVEEMPELQKEMAQAHKELKGCGRLVVRYSGTEPLLRVMIESDSEQTNEAWMRRLLEAVEKDFSRF